ncbi:orotate phosphoribosyltransferase [Luteolibacter sp. AS25]|uniref:orotate phosphoribosyltransferase n=1 Tax=Luteolibacter sp. AS25 TaxID=3135776 RepID=UPI00398AACB5
MKMHSKTLAVRITQAAKLHGSFRLRSGKVSDSYFDKYQFEAIPELLADIAEEMRRFIPDGTEVLAGLEMGGIPIVTMLSQVSGLHSAFIRKTPKEYGTCRYSEGANLASKRILLIEDVVSSGGAISDAVSMLRSDGIEVSQALCVIDRETGGYENLEAHGVELLSLFKQSEIDRHA